MTILEADVIADKYVSVYSCPEELIRDHSIVKDPPSLTNVTSELPGWVKNEMINQTKKPTRLMHTDVLRKLVPNLTEITKRYNVSEKESVDEVLRECAHLIHRSCINMRGGMTYIENYKHKLKHAASNIRWVQPWSNESGYKLFFGQIMFYRPDLILKKRIDLANLLLDIALDFFKGTKVSATSKNLITLDDASSGDEIIVSNKKKARKTLYDTNQDLASIEVLSPMELGNIVAKDKKKDANDNDFFKAVNGPAEIKAMVASLALEKNECASWSSEALEGIYSVCFSVMRLSSMQKNHVGVINNMKLFLSFDARKKLEYALFFFVQIPIENEHIDSMHRVTLLEIVTRIIVECYRKIQEKKATPNSGQKRTREDATMIGKKK